MQSLIRAAAIAAIALPFAFSSLAAQNYRGAWTLYGGGIWFSDLNSNGNGDVTVVDGFDGFGEDFLFDTRSDLSLENGWVAGTQLEWWFGNGRFGIRANGGYTERSLELDGRGLVLTGERLIDEDFFLTDLFTDEFGDVNTWLLNGDLMLRILKPERDRTFAPFVTLGAGAVIYNPAGSRPIFIPSADAVIGDVGSVAIIDTDVDDLEAISFTGDGNSESSFAIDFGIGTDILPAGLDFGPFGLGLRAEVVDHYAFDSPASPLRLAFDEDLDRFVLREGDDFDGVHNVRATLGALLTFGELFPEEPVAVAPAPPPPPEEEAISVCVVDPSLEGQLGFVDAVFRPATGDTLVTDATGEEVPFETVYNSRSPLYAANTSWYRSGRPMTLNVEGQTIEFVSFGGERIIQPDELEFIGTYRGTPIFADASDVMALSSQARMLLEDDDEIEDKLEENMELREELGELDVVYVPVEVGCVFQPYRMVEEVRKERG